MIRWDGGEGAVGEDPADFAAEGVVEFRPAAIAVHDPGAAFHQILSQFGDGFVDRKRGSGFQPVK